MKDLNNTVICLQTITEEEMLRLCNAMPKGPARTSAMDRRTTAWAMDVFSFQAGLNELEMKFKGMLKDIDAIKRNGGS